MLVPRESVCLYPGRLHVSTQGEGMLVPRESVCVSTQHISTQGGGSIMVLPTLWMAPNIKISHPLTYISSQPPPLPPPISPLT